MAHECGRDGVPCFGLSACYAHLKTAALNGGRDRLSPEELAFVGVGGVPRRDTSGGWHQAGNLAGPIGEELSAEEQFMLAALMAVDAPNRDRLEFLGG